MYRNREIRFSVNLPKINQVSRKQRSLSLTFFSGDTINIILSIFASKQWEIMQKYIWSVGAERRRHDTLQWRYISVTVPQLIGNSTVCLTIC